MLLRVDKTVGGTTDAHPAPPSGPPLHACLATAPVDGAGASPGSGSGGDATQGATQGAGVVSLASGGDAEPNKTGTILTVGRKNCVATVDDKCVSRGHATIALLSKDPLDEEALAAAKVLMDDGGAERAVMEYGAPSTPEEVRACETSPTGVICVVRDRGSKFGTFVSVDEGLLKENQANDAANTAKAGGDETGDETDDEGGAAKGVNLHQLTEKQARAAELLSGNDTATGAPKFVRLEANQSFPLLQLSHSSASSPHVIILFGPQGSGIRLSLLPLRFTFSRVKKAELDPLLAALHYVGGAHSTQWDAKKSTHLVAPDKTAAAKGIMAWASRRPVVTKAFIEALLGRTAAGDELPKEEDYTPKGSWDKNLQWTEEPSKALKGYRIAVMVDDDNGPLAESAGADVLRLHEEAPTTHAEFNTWWAAQTAKAIEDKRALAVVSSTSKKCKQFHDWLKHDDTIRFTNAKNLAKAITNNDGEGELLSDTKKGLIEKLAGWDAAEKEEEEEGTKKPAAEEVGKPEAAEKAPEEEAPAEPAAEPMEEVDFTNAGGDVAVEEPPEEAPAKASRKSPKRKARREELEEEKEEPERQKRRRKNEEEDGGTTKGRSKKDVPVEEEAEEEEEEPAADKSTTKKSNQSAPTNRRPKKAEESDDEPGLPEERIALPVTADGWLVAAPKKRKAYRKEIDDAEENVPDKSAESERVSLQVRAYVPPNRAAGNRSTARAGGKKKKDFKRFRKNHVLGRNNNAPSNQSYVPTIRLCETLPKESERQRQLQQEQERLEEEQELADQLFNDVGTKSGRKRGGGMRDFLSQGTTTTKKKRGRR
ncbi:hypothetical protein ACHAXT_008756 [Thalassiosira profunda]